MEQTLGKVPSGSDIKGLIVPADKTSQLSKHPGVMGVLEGSELGVEVSYVG